MKKELLRRPVPFENESLSSYLSRLSIANDCPISWLLGEFGLTRYKNINCLRESVKVKYIANSTFINEEDVWKMTVHKFSKNLWDREFNYYRYNKTMYESVINEDGSLFCPICLKENKIHYIHWQLKQVKICLYHNIELLQKCLVCNHSITVKNILDDKCICGAILSETNTNEIMDCEIISNQTRIYRAFSINLDNNEDKYFNDLKPTQYIEFVTTLYEKIEENIDFLKNIKDEIENINCYSNELYSLLICERILNDWPKSFYLLLEDLNNIEMMECIDKNELGYFTWLNPTIYFYFHNNENKNIYKFFYDTQYEYFVRKFNINYFTSKLESQIYLKEYINEEHATQIFGLDCLLKTDQTFNTYKFNNKNYFRLNDIVEFFETIIKRAQRLDDDSLYKQNTSVIYIYEIFNSLDITMNDIFVTINKYNLQVYVNPFYGLGIKSIYVNQKEIKRYLLNLALKKLDLCEPPHTYNCNT